MSYSTKIITSVVLLLFGMVGRSAAASATIYAGSNEYLRITYDKTVCNVGEPVTITIQTNALNGTAFISQDYYNRDFHGGSWSFTFLAGSPWGTQVAGSTSYFTTCYVTPTAPGSFRIGIRNELNSNEQGHGYVDFEAVYPNQPPTVNWSELPAGTLYRGVELTAVAVGQDPDGNMNLVHTELSTNSGSWTPYAYNGGGNGTIGYTDRNLTTASMPNTTYQWRARSGDSYNAGSGWIYSAVYTVANRAPSTSLTLNGSNAGTSIFFGQTVGFQSTMSDLDGDLLVHSIWHEQGQGLRWTNISLPWNYPANSTGFSAVSGVYHNGDMPNRYSNTIYGNFTPQFAGTFGFLMGGYDSTSTWSDWSASNQERGLTVSKATPSGSFANRSFTGAVSLSAADLNAVFANPYSATVTSPSGTRAFNIVSSSGSGANGAGLIGVGTLLKPGSYNIRASYPGDSNYLAASVDASFVVSNRAPNAPTQTIPAVIYGQSGSFVFGASDPDYNVYEIIVHYRNTTTGSGWRILRASDTIPDTAWGYSTETTTDINAARSVALAVDAGSGSASLSATRAFSPDLGAGTYEFYHRTVDSLGSTIAATATGTVTKAAPVGTFASRAYSGTTILTAGMLNATFAHSTNPSGTVAPAGAISYAITSGGSGNALGQSLAPGTYTITAAFPGDGNYATASVAATFTVSPAPQTVALSPATHTITAGQSLTFTPAGGQNGYVWGGTSGASGSGSTKTVAFSTPGTFSVTAYSPAGGAGGYAQSNTASVTVTVNPVPQTIAISPTSGSVQLGQSLSFAASGGQNGYTWGGSASGSGSPIVVTFNFAGNAIVSVFSPAGGIYGQSNTASAAISVTKATPTPVFAARTLKVADGGTYTIGAGDLNATFSNPNGGFASPTGSISYSVVSTGVTVLAGTQFGPGPATIRATYPGDANFESTSVVAAFTFIQDPPAFTSATSTTAQLGQAFSFQVTTTNSPTSWGATGLPPGLTFNASTGLISGSPVASGVFSVALSASNYGGTGTGTLQITVPQVTATSAGTIVFNDAIAQGVAGYSPTTSTKTATITNTGNTPLNITGFYVFGDQAAGDFFSAAPSSFTIPAGGSREVIVTFGPSSPGNKTGQFIAINSDSTASPLKFVLQGTGLSGPATYRLIVLSGPNGTASGGGVFPAGTTVSASATPSQNFGFGGWSGSITSAANPLSFALNADTTVQANFVQLYFNLSASVSGGIGGSVSGGGSYPSGSVASPRPVPPATGYFVQWLGDLSGDSGASDNNPNPPASLLMNADKAIVAVFATKGNQTINLENPGNKPYNAAPFPVVASASSGLPVSFTIVSGPATVSGSTVTLTGQLGTVVIRADQAGNRTVNAAPSVSVSFDVENVPGNVVFGETGATIRKSDNVSKTGNANAGAQPARITP